MKIAILALVLVAGVFADIKSCHPEADNTGCDVSECCIGEEEFYKVSKREDLMDLPKLDPVFPWGNRRGRCIAYKNEGDNCFSNAPWQTCGCATGLKCVFTPAPEALKRAIPPWLLPKGTHACTKEV